MPHQTQDQYVLSFYRVRQALGVLGIVFPFLLIFGGWLENQRIEPSISDYYHTTLRDIFVGALFAIGIFLVSYKGHARKNGERFSDNLAATIAGLGAFGLAVFPNQLVPGTKNIFEFFLGEGAKWGHFLSAILFLGAMAYFALVKFSRTLNPIRRRIYRLCGWVIVVGGVGATVLSVLRALPNLGMSDQIESLGLIFWCEAFGIWAFGVSWLVKGKADIMVLRQIKRTRRNRHW
jgi:putative copper export protein